MSQMVLFLKHKPELRQSNDVLQPVLQLMVEVLRCEQEEEGLGAEIAAKLISSLTSQRLHAVYRCTVELSL